MMNILKMVATKKGALLALGALVAASATGAATFKYLPNKNESLQLRELRAANQKMKIDHDRLKTENTNLASDRDNILAQTKNLLADKAKFSEVQEERDQLASGNEALTKQKDKLHRDSQKMKKDLEDVVNHFDRLKVSYQEMDSKRAALARENDDLRKTLQRKVQAAPEYQALEKQSKALVAENRTLAATIAALDIKMKKTLERVKRIQDRDLKFAKQIDGLKKETSALKAENTKLVDSNKLMNQKVDDAPARFKAMAVENNALYKETAEMHYNLGVFFTENRKYPNAVKEFERALVFNPNNAKVHYNLGYLYSEELKQHDRAMMHFGRFLEIDPNSKESNDVRAYLLVRDSYGDRSLAGKYSKKGL